MFLKLRSEGILGRGVILGLSLRWLSKSQRHCPESPGDKDSKAHSAAWSRGSHGLRDRAGRPEWPPQGAGSTGEAGDGSSHTQDKMARRALQGPHGSAGGDAGHREAPCAVGAEEPAPWEAVSVCERFPAKQHHPSREINAVHLSFIVLQLHFYPVCDFCFAFMVVRGV